jgi:ubiquinone/menaquinone biosynthesis C-methylase UbiE
MNPVIGRYSAKAGGYAQYRWDYAVEAIQAIFDIAQLSEASTIADVGAGTGMVSRHFVERVRQVFAIEPSLEMRQIAAQSLRQFPPFCNIDGLAEATTLPNRSVDLIAVGRAIHWFPPESTRNEFRRILKPGGWLAILRIPCVDTALLEAIKAIRTEENGWNTTADKSKLAPKPFSFYYGHEEFQKLYFPDIVQESLPEFFGRISSLSPAPNEGHPLYSNFEQAVRKVFDRFSSNGCLTINIATELFLGQIK